MDMRRGKLRQLLANHPHLDSFNYIEENSRESQFHFDVIAEQQPKLKQLGYVIRYSRSAEGFEHLKSLKFLKSLSVPVMPLQEPHIIDYLNTVASNGLLESLVLHGDHTRYLGRETNPDFILALSSVHSLHELTLIYGAHTMAELIKYAKSMPLLEKITIRCSDLTMFGLNINTLLGLLAVAVNLREINFHLAFRGQGDFPVSMQLLEQCEDAVRQRSNPKSREFKLNICAYATTSAFVGELVQITSKKCTCN